MIAKAAGAGSTPHRDSVVAIPARSRGLFSATSAMAVVLVASAVLAGCAGGDDQQAAKARRDLRGRG